MRSAATILSGRADLRKAPLGRLRASDRNGARRAHLARLFARAEWRTATEFLDSRRRVLDRTPARRSGSADPARVASEEGGCARALRSVDDYLAGSQLPDPSWSDHTAGAVGRSFWLFAVDSRCDHSRAG